LDKLYRQIGDAQDSGQPVPLHWLYEQNRLKTTKALISGQIDQYGALARGTTIGLKKTGVQLGEQSGMAQLDATMPKSTPSSFGVPSDTAIASIVGSTQKGSPLADLFNGWGSEAADRAGKILISAITLGDNPRKIARDIADALDISRSRALTIARTEMLRVYRESALETYRANDDVVEGWVWMSALDARCCAVCIAMHGTVHSLDEDLDGHPNCRCTKSPRVKGSSFDPLLGSDWFDNQSEAIQRQILGSKASYDAYNDGASLSDFVGVNHDKDWGSSVYQKSAKDVSS
jgi:SPP1 gp7 family putative phage head morphogenesis protein